MDLTDCKLASSANARRSGRDVAGGPQTEMTRQVIMAIRPISSSPPTKERRPLGKAEHILVDTSG